MVSERNRSIALANYISSLGLEVNLQKNKARGNKGFFANRNGQCRIDVSCSLPEDELASVLIHEFAHYFHFTHDKTLQSLDFIFGKYDDDFLNELIEITVNSVDKQNASELFNLKEQTNCSFFVFKGVEKEGKKHQKKVFWCNLYELKKNLKICKKFFKKVLTMVAFCSIIVIP